MSVHYTMKGMDSFLRDVGQQSERVQNSVDTELNRSSLRIEGRAAELAPFDTGFLSLTIYSWQKQRFLYEVIAPQHYAIYQEYGTRYHMAQPFMYPAVEEEFPILMERLGRIMKG